MKLSTRTIALPVLACLATVGPAAAIGGSGPALADPSTAAVSTAGDCTQPGPYQLPQGSDRLDLDPAQFTTTIDNPYWPMTPGTTWHYIERGGGTVAEVTITVTDQTKVIRGVTARVVHDSVREDGVLVEDTRDWYAQDAGGSIWYLGEHSVTYENGVPVSTEGSWRYGRHGAQAGVIVPANPAPGCGYREEYRKGTAEDQALVLATSEPIEGPTGSYTDVLHTANTTPLKPTLLENKFYARGVGPVLELDISPDLGSVVLVDITH